MILIKISNEWNRTLRGSDRVKMVTSGMYRTAMPEPTIHALKYRLWNQSTCFGPTLTTNNQKHSSVACVGVLAAHHPKLVEITRYLRGV